MNTANKAEGKTKIYEDTYLNQQYLKRNRFLKINLHSQDDQANKKATVLKVKDNINQAK